MADLPAKKVLVAPSQFGEKSLRLLEENRFKPIQNPFRRKLTEEETVSLLQGVPAIIAGLEPLNASVLERTRLKVISRCGSGMSNVDLEAARALGIRVFSTPNGPTTAVAEATISALFILMRRFPQASESLHAGKWEKSMGSQLKGRTAGIFGFGRIGREVARFLTTFGVQILVSDPFVSKEEIRCVGAVPMAREEILPRADIVSIHISGDNTVIGANEFAILKKGCFFLNASRGAAVDETSLLRAAQDGTVCGFWLDVFSQEPYRGPLLGCPQALLTPHIASYTYEGRESMEMESVENLLRGFREE